jgi:hypothetical protein
MNVDIIQSFIHLLRMSIIKLPIHNDDIQLPSM